jgi:hypothetical protein
MVYQHPRLLFGAIWVAFLDTTSLYSGGHGGATPGQHGHSKDFRPQLAHVVPGIVLDEWNRPIASFLWPGNAADACPRAWPGDHHPAAGDHAAA